MWSEWNFYNQCWLVSVGLNKLWIIQFLWSVDPCIAAGGVGGFGGHVVLTAGEAEIRDGHGGTEGRGHLESRRSQFLHKLPSSFCQKMYTEYGHTSHSIFTNIVYWFDEWTVEKAPEDLNEHNVEWHHVGLLLEMWWVWLMPRTDLFKLTDDAS